MVSGIIVSGSACTSSSLSCAPEGGIKITGMGDELARTKRKASLCSTVSPKNYFSIAILIFFFPSLYLNPFPFLWNESKAKDHL